MMKLKQVVRLALISAAVVSSSAMAANVTGTDLIVFVQDTTTGTYYIGDTGISLNSLLTQAQIASAEAASPLGQTVDFTSLLAPTAAALNNAPNLASFLTSHTGDTFTWAIMSADPNTVNGGSGQNRLLFTSSKIGTNVGGTGVMDAGGVQSLLGTAVEGATGTALSQYNGWISTINGATLTNNTSTTVGFGIGTGGVPAKNAFISSLFPVGAAVGTAQYLYLFAETAFGQGGGVNGFEATSSITLNANGTFTVTSLSGGSPVPLPAAAWLLGSGLLGLFGVGRRRRAA
ncbi:MAG: VPLPA-CTERM sorting domain-containing protein [Proteobacteria bacterium]|nr:VPLPA-CTERM sorting domain-containing protein [Pseudomonadota bacterium]